MLRAKVIKSKVKGKRIYQIFLHQLNFIDEDIVLRIINEYIMELKLKHTLEIFRWYAVNFN